MAKVIQPNVFARVSGGVILEFPVTQEMIRNRNAPLNMFARVQYTNNPDVGPYQKHRTEVRVEAKVVYATVVVEDLSLDELLTKLLNDAHAVDRTVNRAVLQNVPVEAIYKVSSLTEREAMVRLNALAKSRRYDGIDSAPAFKDSHIEKFRLEAERMIFLRSQVFADLETYEQKVISGNLPVPLSTEEIFSHLEKIEWGDAVPQIPLVVETELLVEEPVEEDPVEVKPKQDPLDPIMSFT